MHLDWLDEGAIQLVLPESLLDRWSGIDSSDYDRACASSDDWINQLSVGGGLGLVLGGDNAMPLVVPEDDGSIVIIRWIFGEDERELVAFALRGEAIQRTEPDLVFDNADSTWRLFDAAPDPLAHGPSSRTVSLPLGRVRVQTTYHESERNAAIVHRFSRAA
jgi:Immunity protein 21